MRKYFARRPLRRRIVALAAAYAIALASLIASFGAASAAADAAATPGGIICHASIAGDESPAPPAIPIATTASAIAASAA